MSRGRDGDRRMFAGTRLKSVETFRRKKLAIIKRDACCKICNKTYDLTVHHIIPLSEAKRFSEIKYFSSPFNLITLCKFCHVQLHEGNIIYPQYLKGRWAFKMLKDKFYSSSEKVIDKPKERINRDYIWRLIIDKDQLSWQAVPKPKP